MDLLLTTLTSRLWGGEVSRSDAVCDNEAAVNRLGNGSRNRQCSIEEIVHAQAPTPPKGCELSWAVLNSSKRIGGRQPLLTWSDCLQGRSEVHSSPILSPISRIMEARKAGLKNATGHADLAAMTQRVVLACRDMDAAIIPRGYAEVEREKVKKGERARI